MPALLRVSLLSASMLLASACLFPGFDELVCESDCGGSTGTAPTGAGSQAGSDTGAGDPAGGGGQPPVGGGGSGGGVPGCGTGSVLIDPPGEEWPNYCIDAYEVIWADYEPFVDQVTFMDSLEFYALAGDECAYQEKTTEAFRAGGSGFDYVFNDLTDDDMQLPAVAMSWCEARIYCRSHGKDLCGGVDGGVDDGPDNLSQWVAACSGFDANNFTYGDTYLPTSCFTDGCKTPPDPPPTDYHALWPAEPSECESAAYPGLYNMTGNADELVDNCVPNQPEDDDPATDVCLPRGATCNGDQWAECSYVSIDDVRRDGRGNYTTFRCCWSPNP